MGKIRVADYIAQYIHETGVRDVFMVSGGGIMFLTDGIACHDGLNAICNHHEQASAMAAVGYAKYNGKMGVAYLTTGCGGTNAVTGVLHAWQDNVPCLFVSGQSKRKETVRLSGLKLRQFGVQEADIIPVVESITKYSVMVTDPEDIRYHVEKALYLAGSGRPGPVWIDVPLDVQGALVEPEQLRKFDPSEEKEDYRRVPTDAEMDTVVDLLKNSKRPIVIAGQGVRLSGGIEKLRGFVEKNNIPVVVSRLGFGLLPTNHSNYLGCIGNKGNRASNFALQNSDLVISIGSRLSVSSTGHEYHLFAREAVKVIVDIDPVEHKKGTVKVDHFINSDASEFLKRLEGASADCSDWIEKCRTWKQKWPAYLPEYDDDSRGINLYCFVKLLGRNMKSDSVVITDAGSTTYVPPQVLDLAEGQRYIPSGAQAEMGFTVPGVIGASVARGRRDVIGIVGDGSLQMNIQELQTIKHNNLPIKLFIWNNDGYLSIRATQRKFFDERYIGTDCSCGVSFPDLEKLAEAYGLRYMRAENHEKLDEMMKKAIEMDGPVICDVKTIRDQEILPTVSSKKLPDGRMVSLPLEDMYPFLDRKEFNENMIVKPVNEEKDEKED